MRLVDVIVSLGALGTILTRPGIRAAEAGFILAFSTTISTSAMSILGNLSMFELRGISLERTAEYRMLEHEEDLSPDSTGHWGTVQENSTVSASLQQWPDKGSLQIRNLSASYGADLPDILHDVSFSVEGGQRIGIVGASGGGKSTLVKTFFAFVDITSGKIEVDGKGKLISMQLQLITC